MVNSFWRRLRQQLLPHHCYLCLAASGRGVAICQACEQDLHRLGHRCYQCAYPLPSEAELCGQCLQHPPTFSRTVAGWYYDYPVNLLIQHFKYHRKQHYGALLATLLLPVLRQAYYQQPLPDAIVATPMHWRRRLQRGDNHAQYLAQIFSEQLGIPLLSHVKRQRHTRPQESLSKAQRRANLKHAFTVSTKLNIRGKRLVVVDDVMTTGATVDALSQCLLDAGAADVHVWCLARTPRGD